MMNDFRINISPLPGFIVLISFLTLGAPAGTITTWNFNSLLPDATPSTGTMEPSGGGGSLLVLGGVTSAFATGDSSSGGDPAGATDNSGLQTTSYPASSAANLSAGLEARVSTAGWHALRITWRQRNSSTASRYFLVQCTANGSDFTDVGRYAVTADAVWTNIDFSLAAFPAAFDNPQFAFRILAEFEDSATGAGVHGYAATKPGAIYGGSGTVRFDMLSVLGTGAGETNQPPPVEALLLRQDFEVSDFTPVSTLAGWSTRSGVQGEALIQAGALLISSRMTEDVVAELGRGPWTRGNGTVLYSAFRLKALSLPRATPGLIAHFADGTQLRGRIYVTQTNAQPGHFRLGVGNGGGSTAGLPVIIEQDLATNTLYLCVTRYAIDTAMTRAWIDPMDETTTGTDAVDVQTPIQISRYGFREDADIGGDFVIDDLRVGLSFAEVAGIVPKPNLTLTRVGEAEIELSWKQGRLESASRIDGQFSEVPEATSPWVVRIGQGNAFFRVVQ